MSKGHVWVEEHHAQPLFTATTVEPHVQHLCNVCVCMCQEFGIVSAKIHVQGRKELCLLYYLLP
eukprot:6337910-Amphidinium_carterae.1